MTYVTAKIPIETEKLVELDGEASYLVFCPHLNNINATGKTMAEALKEIKAMVDAYFEVRLND